MLNISLQFCKITNNKLHQQQQQVLYFTFNMCAIFTDIIKERVEMGIGADNLE